MGRRFWSFRIFCFFFFFLMIRRPPRSTRVRCRQRQMCIRDRGGAGARKARAATAGALVVDKEWASREWDLRSAMRTRRFWLVSVARGLELLSLQMLLTHQAAFFVDAGFDKMVAASVVGTVGIVGSVGKIMWG